MAERVRMIGNLWHGRVPEGAVYIGRACPGHKRSFWHNPFRVGHPMPAAFGTGTVRDRAHAVELYERLVAFVPAYRDRARRELAGVDLACWCPLDAACHGDVLLRLANPVQVPA